MIRLLRHLLETGLELDCGWRESARARECECAPRAVASGASLANLRVAPRLEF